MLLEFLRANTSHAHCSRRGVCGRFDVVGNGTDANEKEVGNQARFWKIAGVLVKSFFYSQVQAPMIMLN